MNSLLYAGIMQQSLRSFFLLDNLSNLLVPESEFPPLGAHVSDAKEAENQTNNARQRDDSGVNADPGKIVLRTNPYLDGTEDARY